MVFVDSSVWIDYFNGSESRQVFLLDAILGRDPVCIGDLVYAEVLQGFRDDRDFLIARRLLDTMIFEPMLGKDMAFLSAQNYRKLRKRGVTVRKMVDVMIATFCIEMGHDLLHSDRDFVPMVKHLGLSVL